MEVDLLKLSEVGSKGLVVVIFGLLVEGDRDDVWSWLLFLCNVAGRCRECDSKGNSKCDWHIYLR